MENLIFFKNYNIKEYMKVFNQYFSSWNNQGEIKVGLFQNVIGVCDQTFF